VSIEPVGLPARVIVVDVDISFWQLVKLFVKAAIAVIPATIILGALLALLGFVLALFGAFGPV
jgi:hypothetical protein